MTHRYIRTSCSGRLTIAAPDAPAAKHASIWTAL